MDGRLSEDTDALGGHVLRVEVDRDMFGFRAECREPEGADCRLTCAERCDAETYPCFSADDVEHERTDSGECNVCLWLNDTNVDECHGPTREPLFDGMPIEVFWEGDHYSWTGKIQRELGGVG